MESGKSFLSLFDIQTRLLKLQGIDGQGAEQLIVKMANVFRVIVEAGDTEQPDLSVCLRRLTDAARKVEGSWMGTFAKLFASIIPVIVSRREVEVPKRVSAVVLPAAPAAHTSMPSTPGLPRSPLVNIPMQFPASTVQTPVAVPHPQDTPRVQGGSHQDDQDDLEIIEVDPTVMEPAAPSVEGGANDTRNDETVPLDHTAADTQKNQEEEEIQIIEDEPPSDPQDTEADRPAEAMNDETDVMADAERAGSSATPVDDVTNFALFDNSLTSATTPSTGEKEKKRRGRPPGIRTPAQKKQINGQRKIMGAWLSNTKTTTANIPAAVPGMADEDDIEIIEEDMPTPPSVNGEAGTASSTPSVNGQCKEAKKRKMGRRMLDLGIDMTFGTVPDEMSDDVPAKRTMRASLTTASTSKQGTPFESGHAIRMAKEEKTEEARAGQSTARSAARNAQKRKAERAQIDAPPTHQGRGGAPNSGGEIRWTCGGVNCRLAFESSAEVYTHMLREHFLEGQLVAKCYDCGRVGDFPELIVHRKHGDEGTCGAEHALLVYWMKVEAEKTEEEMNDEEKEEKEEREMTTELARVLRCCMHKGCARLNQEFASYESLLEHHKEAHNCCYRYACPECERTFTHPGDFIRHRKGNCATEIPNISTRSFDKKGDDEEEEKEDEETSEFRSRSGSGGRDDPISLD